MNKQTSLEKRVVAILTGNGTANASAAELTDIIRDTTAAVSAAQAAVETAEAERLDLVACPDPSEANARIAAAKLSGDRLSAAIPHLKQKLTAALAAEATKKWWLEFRKVKTKLDEAVAAFQEYPHHAEAIAQMFALAAEVDREVSDLNGSAPPGVDRRLRSVELTARTLTQFTRENPSLRQTVELRDFENSGRKLWPRTSSGSLAAAYAGSFPQPPHPGSHWGDRNDPVVQEQRRAVERSQESHARWHEAAAISEEERINRQAQEEFAQAHGKR